jgi:hypothetical protein
MTEAHNPAAAVAVPAADSTNDGCVYTHIANSRPPAACKAHTTRTGTNSASTLLQDAKNEAAMGTCSCATALTGGDCDDDDDEPLATTSAVTATTPVSGTTRACTSTHALYRGDASGASWTVRVHRYVAARLLMRSCTARRRRRRSVCSATSPPSGVASADVSTTSTTSGPTSPREVGEAATPSAVATGRAYNDESVVASGSPEKTHTGGGGGGGSGGEWAPPSPSSKLPTAQSQLLLSSACACVTSDDDGKPAG